MKYHHILYLNNQISLTLLLLNTACPVLANSVDLDQLASDLDAVVVPVCVGSTMVQPSESIGCLTSDLDKHCLSFNM